MINHAELYCYTLEQPLSINGSALGYTHLRYEVREVTEVRNLGQVRTYRVLATQRVVIPNSTPFSLAPSTDNAFRSYPALLSVTSTLSAPGSAQRLVAYSPHTLNANVMTSASNGVGKSASFSQQYTAGSSTSQTNSYGGSVSLGFFGDDPTGSASMDYSQSTTNESSDSFSQGSDRSRNSQAEAGSSMSIKDWGSYARLDTTGTVPTWVWGQEYPWDVIQYRYCPTGDEVLVPEFVLERLFGKSGDTVFANPPSQLSLFGIDFTMKATWMVELPGDLARQSVTLDHKIQYTSASHWLEGGRQRVQLNPAPIQLDVKSPPLDLTLLGLDPVKGGARDNGAVIGFVASKFIAPPSTTSGFKILSGANNLQVTGSGFDRPMFSSLSKGTATLRIQFKVVDGETPYSLLMKHWKTTAAGCLLQFVFNGDKAHPVTRTVDALEGEGGGKNLLAVEMRNTNYSSIDYHDYLVMGLNTVDVTISPLDGAAQVGYELRALAVGEA